MKDHTVRPKQLALVAVLATLPLGASANVLWDTLVWDSGVWAGDDPNDPDVDGVVVAVDNCPFDQNPDQADLDGDTLGNPCDPDADGDGLVLADETRYGTNPLNVDSDNDGLDDGVEVALNRNPAVNEGAALGPVMQLLLSD